MTDIATAIQILKSGGLVAFPTETVYGLGADATNASAVRRIFAIKGRPPTNPLIVHVTDPIAARRWAADWPTSADRLTARYWPGPLTLVLPRCDAIPDEVTAARRTVALRSPLHPLAQALLTQFNGPIAAPSANRSTRVSPTTAQHVRDELGDAISCILDGGPCVVGIESTVLDLTADIPTILRPGAITAEQIEAVIGPVTAFHGVAHPLEAASSPGQAPVHYAPHAIAYRFDAADGPAVAAWSRQHPNESWVVMLLGAPDPASPHGQLAPVADSVPPEQQVLQMPATAREYARDLYATFRELDARQIKTLWVQLPPDEPQWTAIRDRLVRATRPCPLR